MKTVNTVHIAMDKKSALYFYTFTFPYSVTMIYNVYIMQTTLKFHIVQSIQIQWNLDTGIRKTCASCKGVPLRYSGLGFDFRRGHIFFTHNFKFQSLHLNKSSRIRSQTRPSPINDKSFKYPKPKILHETFALN